MYCQTVVPLELQYIWVACCKCLQQIVHIEEMCQVVENWKQGFQWISCSTPCMILGSSSWAWEPMACWPILNTYLYCANSSYLSQFQKVWHQISQCRCSWYLHHSTGWNFFDSRQWCPVVECWVCCLGVWLCKYLWERGLWQATATKCMRSCESWPPNMNYLRSVLIESVWSLPYDVSTWLPVSRLAHCQLYLFK